MCMMQGACQQASCSTRCSSQPCYQSSLQPPVPRALWAARARQHARQHAGRPAQRRVSASGALGELADAVDLVPLVIDFGPLVGAGIVLAGLAALRFTAYSQLEYITAAMLARHVKAGGARVLQLGGTTRDIFYYPQGTTQVTVVGPDLKEGLWEQAGIQAQVPVVVKAQAQPDTLLFQRAESCDSVVLLNQLAAVTDIPEFCSEVYRVLKPGGTFVFVQRVRGGALQPLVLGGPRAVDATTVDMVMEYPRWDYVQCDPALQTRDLHAVGVAIKPLRAAQPQADNGFSVDKTAFEQMMKSGSRSRGGGAASNGSTSQGFGKK